MVQKSQEAEAKTEAKAEANKINKRYQFEIPKNPTPPVATRCGTRRRIKMYQFETPKNPTPPVATRCGTRRRTTQCNR